MNVYRWKREVSTFCNFAEISRKLSTISLVKKGFKRAVAYAILVYPNRGNEAPGRPRTLLFP
jgi:hypothetical protein